MLKTRLLIFLAMLVPASCFASEMGVEPAPDMVERYEPVSIKIELPYFSSDITDPAQVEVSVEIILPDGSRRKVPAFNLSNTKSAPSLWEARFTPVNEGSYRYSVSARAGDLFLSSREYSINVKQGSGDGFLRNCPNNSNYLRFDSGRPFFGIGHNIAWLNNSSPKLFNRYFSLLARSGGNLSRIWMCDWSFPLEWEKPGKYNARSAQKLDETINAARENGIYILLCLDTYGSLMEEPGMWGEERWKDHPYNAANGGPCAEPADFFTDPEAKRLYKNRLRYIVSRWGYSPNILAFELWNEYNAPPEWTKEMASYIKAIDPAGHLVTTSLGYPYGELFDSSLIWEIEDIDIVTIHHYGSGVETDIISPLMQKSLSAGERYSKPFIVSEFGIDFGKDDKYHDPEGKGTELHNSLWASLVSGGMGTAMNWWHDTYIRPAGLYAHYAALSEFASGIDWCSEKIEYPRVSDVKSKLPPGMETSYRDVTILPLDTWGKIDDAEFTVLNNGDLAGPGIPVKYLHGWTKEEMRTDHVYHVDYPERGKFVVRVGTVSQGGHLNIFIDDEKVLKREFPAGAGKGPWKSSKYLEKYDVYQCVYDEDVEVTVPRGKHSIRLENAGRDWIGIERVILKDYSDSTVANARCLALTVGEESIIWVHNKDSNWKNASGDIEPPLIQGAYFELYGLSEGYYDIEWWDTYGGGVTSREKVKSEKGKIVVEVPDLKRDAACKIRQTVPPGNAR